MKWFIRIIICFICEKIPKKKNRIVFTSWYGTKYADNPKYLYERMIEIFPDEFDYIWILEDISNLPTKYNSKVAKKKSLKAFYYCVTASITVFTHGYIEFSNFNLIKGSYTVQLWHGVPWKKIGQDTRKLNQGKFRKKLIVWIDSYNLYISSNESQTEIIRQSFNISKKSKILEIGQPRNSIFFDKEKIIRIQEKNREQLLSIKKQNIDNSLIITYMPTFRDNGDLQSPPLNNEDLEFIASSINKPVYLVNKSHFKGNFIKSTGANILDVGNMDTQELLAITDILITDYSSCLFDFILLNRPVIQYIFDYKDYYNDRGFYYDLDEVDCGHLEVNKERLLYKIITLGKREDINLTKLATVSKRFNKFESNDSLDKLIKYIKDNAY